MGAASPDQMFRQGYLLLSIGRYQQGVRLHLLISSHSGIPRLYRSGLECPTKLMGGKEV